MKIHMNLFCLIVALATRTTDGRLSSSSSSSQRVGSIAVDVTPNRRDLQSLDNGSEAAVTWKKYDATDCVGAHTRIDGSKSFGGSQNIWQTEYTVEEMLAECKSKCAENEACVAFNFRDNREHPDYEFGGSYCQFWSTITDTPDAVGDSKDCWVASKSSFGQTSNPTPESTIDPGSFCHALGVKNGCDLSGPGSCQINPGPNNEPSCGFGVPAGYYPDLNNCNAYCKCTGTTAPSQYEIVNTGLEWDNFQQEGSNYYLPGQMGKDGAWGTNGGGAGRPSDMSVEGRLRPGGPDGKTCGPKQTCPSGSYKSQPWDNCTKWYTCNNGKSGPVQKCPGGLLFRADLGICDWAANVKCN